MAATSLTRTTFVTLLFTLATSAVAAEPLRVPQDHESIQAAIDAATVRDP